MTVLLTGATGFLGSALVETLLEEGFKVIALKRNSSNPWRCSANLNEIIWVDIDNPDEAESQILKHNPEILIHSAWGGIKASDRDNWKEQVKNLLFFVSILEIAKKAGVERIISMGSQAEYGIFDGIVDETYPCNPVSAYGAAKLSASVLLQSFAAQNNIEWYWIRLFSVFGPREDNNWLIPSSINSMLKKKEMKLSPCDQKYDYLYIKDFASGITNIIKSVNAKSGIYNFSSGNSIQLKDILNYLETAICPVEKILRIGALPYRKNQVMHMEGNSDLFFKSFNFKPEYSIFAGLDETINYFIENSNNEQIQ